MRYIVIVTEPSVANSLQTYKVKKDERRELKKISDLCYSVISSHKIEKILKEVAGVKSVEVDKPIIVSSTANVTDPLYPTQWPLKMLNAENAWKYSSGSGIRVAVVDTGIDYTHKDLGGLGIEITANDSPSIVASKLGEELSRVENGEHLSLAYAFGSSALQEAINQCVANNILVIAAAGNNDERVDMYPAAFNGVFSVGGVDSSGNRWKSSANDSRGSNYGSYLDVVAPSGPMNVLMFMRSRHTIHIGTSLAAPLVAGIAALCMSVDRNLSISDLRNILIASTGKEKWHEELGWGIPEAYKAVTLTKKLLDQRNPKEDVNGDGVVDVLDLVTVSSHLGRKVGDSAEPKWIHLGDGSPADRADVNKDGVVDVLDLTLIGLKLQETPIVLENRYKERYDQS